MSERKYYGNYALAAGVLLFVCSIGWSFWYTKEKSTETNRLIQEYATACNRAGGIAIAPEGMYQCVKLEKANGQN